MYVVYDTRTVHPLDRFDAYRHGAADEFAPVAVDGRPLPDLLAAMSAVQVGDFTIEVVTWEATGTVVARRTEHLIRAGDSECYRIFLTVDAGVRMEQAGNQVVIRERDIGMFDLSLPWQATHPVGTSMRVIMLSFPRSLMPVAESVVRPLLGTTVPRRLPGRSLVAQSLIGLTTNDATEHADLALPGVLQECIVGLVRRWLGQPAGITPRIQRLLHQARIRAIIRRHLDHPTLDPDRIANAAHISTRYLHSIFRDAEFPLMQQVKRMRLEKCHDSLQDPELFGAPIKDIIFMCGYRRPDQFARDLKQVYHMSARDVRRLAHQRLTAGRS